MLDFLFLSNADTGGQGYAITQAINRYTEYTARCIKINQNYIQYPYDLCSNLGQYSLLDGKFYSKTDIINLVKEAKVLVFDTYDRYYGYDILFEDYYIGKKVVYRHNGDQCRRNSFIVDRFHQRNNDAVVVSTPDLLKSIPHVKNKIWLPNLPIDLEYMSSFDLPRYNKTIVIGHTPTNPLRKGTFEFIEALGEIASKYPISFDPIAFTPFYESIYLRATTHHIYFDQITTDIRWYGNASVEASWLGQPVICNELLEGYIDTPFYTVTFENLKERLEELFSNMNKEFYEELQAKHLEWVKKEHNPEILASKHAEWMLDNAREWSKDHQFLTDKISLVEGWRWVRGKGIPLNKDNRKENKVYRDSIKRR